MAKQLHIVRRLGDNNRCKYLRAYLSRADGAIGFLLDDINEEEVVQRKLTFPQYNMNMGCDG